MRLSDIMTTRVETIAENESASVAWERMRQKRIHHLVVTRRGEVVGVVSARDLGGRLGDSVRSNRTVGEVMTPYAVTADPRATVRQAANMLRGRGIGSLPIVERGRLLGIVTVADLLELIGRGVERPVVLRERRHRRPSVNQKGANRSWR
ncbi:MAG TPA: CBS domain-containing protein [Planctomycetota bacterium]|jgi:acetoin utilization protein AcuB|nr:CBS domain-containing protein [Planctomycetota bacterium]